MSENQQVELEGVSVQLGREVPELVGAESQWGPEHFISISGEEKTLGLSSSNVEQVLEWFSSLTSIVFFNAVKKAARTEQVKRSQSLKNTASKAIEEELYKELRDLEDEEGK